jgi:hypothetical protein
VPNLPGANGSSFTTTQFTVAPGAVLKFNFNFITSGAVAGLPGFSDYAWAQLQTPAGVPVATLVTAKTQPTGSVIPATGVGFPPMSATLNPASVPIIATGPPAGPDWAPLGLFSAICFGPGCGYTGWVGATYNIPAAGAYVLKFGVSNVLFELFDSGLAFNGATINGALIGGTDITAPGTYLASNLGVTVNPVFAGGALRMDQPGAAYAQNFTLDGSLTNTIDEFGNFSTFAGVFSDATPGVPGNIVIATALPAGR